MKIKEILALIPDELLGQLARDTQVDYYAKKLSGFGEKINCEFVHIL
ncbi:hypothetical protein [Runella sp.]